MNKVLLQITLLFLLMPLTALNAQQYGFTSGVWDEKNAVYVNDQYHLKWYLTEGVKWEPRPIVGGSNLLKMRWNEANILVRISVDKSPSIDYDAWDALDYYNSPQFRKVVEAGAKQLQMQLKDFTSSRSQICGIHAIKSKVIQTQYHADSKVTEYYVEYNYMFCKGAHRFSVIITDLSMHESDQDIFDRYANLLIQNFRIDTE